MITITAGPSENGSRLDRFLRKRLPLLGLSQVYGLIRKGAVRIDDKKVKQDHRIKEGELIAIDVNESEFEAEAKPQNAMAKLVKTDFFKRNFKILFEDSGLIACDKPAGLVVHPGSGHLGHDNLIDLATAYILSKDENGGTPVLMHRLDRDTSGVILLAKNKGVVRVLHDDMRAGKFTKQYITVCHNRPPEFEDTVTFGMKRTDRRGSGMKMHVDDDGGESSTTYKILEYQNNLSRLEVLLHTGKTHQIRVHMSHLNAPVLGDERYGDKGLDDKLFNSKKSLNRRLYLHAHKLSFPHPLTKKAVTVTAPVPKEFVSVIG